MYCGGCFHDNTLVAALRGRGHDVTMIPLYLPLTLDEADESASTPIFFSGINVYLEEKIPLFRRAPAWLHKILASRQVLRLAAGSAARTKAEDVGDLTLSMIRGEEGNQVRELDELVAWLRGQGRPDVVSLSNALLLGLVRGLKKGLGAPVVCALQGEDTFLDALPTSQRATAWKVLAERAREVDLFTAPSRYFGELMAARLGLRADQWRVAHNGIRLDGYGDNAGPTHPPTLGYFARMCREKGLELAVETFIILRERGRVPDLRLKVGGGCGPGDEPVVEGVKKRLRSKGLLAAVEFFPNVSRLEKIRFLESLDVFCTPALYGEAFGLYVVEAMAAGVPVVQPRHAAFPELVEATGGGIITEATAEALAGGIEKLLLDPMAARRLGEMGRQRVRENFNADSMAGEIEGIFSALPAGAAW